MFQRLRGTEERYAELERKLADPDVIRDIGLYAGLQKEYKSLTPVISEYRSYLSIKNRLDEAKEILNTSSDAELRALAAEEYSSARDAAEESENRLRVLLIPRDPSDDRNVIVEIRACAGGDEAAIFAADLFRMYSMYCDRTGFRISVASANETDLGGFREIVFTVEGDGAYSRFKFESGVHRVQRVPLTESQGRIQTSTVSVAVLPEADDVEVEIKPSDVVFESCKSSGAGGQHINKTESAVRLTHRPTGIVVECQEERSQFQNKDKAMKMLRAKLYDIARSKQENDIASTRRSQVGSGDRSEKIRTYNFPQDRVTDHRIGLTVHSIESFLAGNIGSMVDALIAADTAEKLKNGV